MNQRQIDLMKLLCEQNVFRPASFFSRKLSVSTKTVYSDFQDIEMFVKKFQVELIRIPGTGVYLEGTKEHKDALKENLLKQTEKDKYSMEYRRLQIVKRLLIESKTITLESLADEFIISKSSLYNDLNAVSKQLGSKCLIISNDNGVYASGDELNIQKAIKQIVSFYTLTKIDGISGYEELLYILFDANIIELVHNILYGNYAELTENVSDYYIRSLEITMITLITRVQMDFHVEKENDFLFNNIRYMETYVVANSMIEFIKQEMNVVFTQEDIEYLCRQLFAHRITNRFKTNETQYTSMVKEIIERMEFIEKVSFDQNDSLYHSLLYHLPAMVVRLKKGIRIHNPLLKDIKNQYSRLFSEVWYALSVLESKYDVVLNDDEISLILIYFQIALDRESKSNNIIVICPYGNSSSQLILNRVKKFLPEKDHIEVSTIDKLQANRMRNVDLIITPIDLNIDTIPVIKVSPLVSNEDLVRILDVYSSFVMEKESKKAFLKKAKDFQSPTIAQFLNIDFVELQVDVESKEECLDLMISKLEQEKYVKTGFRQSVYNREKMGTTSLETGVALPHADSETICQSVISVMTLKHPIRWGSVPVKLVVMMALSTKDIEQFKDAIVELYQIIEKKEYVEEIVEINQKEQMMQLFCK
ncbi:Probable licABCH operon regulator [Chlamydia trachomatis]|nr:Probable licABCH operon regulator [Chlamydia trachomatis]